MASYDAEIAELEAAYNSLRVAKATIRAEVRSKYRKIMDNEIEARQREVDQFFADRLADVKSRSDIPIREIQDNVFRTRTWSTWTYFRDLAGMETERERVRNAAPGRSLGFDWSPDRKTLIVSRNSRNEEIEPVTYDVSNPSKIAGGLWMGQLDEDNERKDLAAQAADGGFWDMVSAEIAERLELE